MMSQTVTVVRCALEIEFLAPRGFQLLHKSVPHATQSLLRASGAECSSIENALYAASVQCTFL